uniref:Oxidoreductase-like domain-containing protein n=1 Tax=Monodelphis domestica TaxID=13616 RepID=A0A5F8HG73_MONDO
MEAAVAGHWWPKTSDSSPHSQPAKYWRPRVGKGGLRAEGNPFQICSCARHLGIPNRYCIRSSRAFGKNKKGQGSEAGIPKSNMKTDPLPSQKGSSHSDGGFSDPQPPLLLPPTNCYMNGCCKCVWIEYAKEFLQNYKDGRAKALAAMDEHIQDENIKIFIKMEIRQLLDYRGGGDMTEERL